MQYQAPKWLPNGHLQTIWPLAIKGRMPSMKRSRWNTPDGDFIDIDFLRGAGTRKVPLLVLFHGLEGSSRSHYARALMRQVSDQGWNGAVVHFRGCSGSPNKLGRAYHSGDADEIDWIMRRMADKYKDGPIYAVGVSLGGNALLCWLGRRREEAFKLVTKAAAVSTPLDLTASGMTLQKGFNKIYTRHFLKSMRRTAAEKAERFPGLFDAQRAQRAKTLFEFDDAFTAPVHGFKNVNDYWQRSSSKPLLTQIAVPTLIINAKNDPFLPRSALPRKREVSRHVTLELTEEGGHVGFVSGTFPGNLNWLPDRLIRYFQS